MVQIQRFKSRHITSRAQLRIFWRVLLNAIFEGEIPWKTLTAARAHWPTCPKQLTVPVRLARRRRRVIVDACATQIPLFGTWKLRFTFCLLNEPASFPEIIRKAFENDIYVCDSTSSLTTQLLELSKSFTVIKLNTQLSIFNPKLKWY